MANDLTIQDTPSAVDTLKFLNTELGTDTTPLDEEADVDDGEKVKRTIAEKSDEDDKEDKLELVENVEDEDDFRPSPSKKAILAEFPELFKKFPQIERAIYRDKAYSELFPSIEEAKNVIERAETLSNTEAKIAKGEIGDILSSIKSEDNDSFLRIVDNFLPSIEKLDKGTYLTLLGNIGKGFIKTMFEESSRIGNDSEGGKTLAQTATVLHQFLFGNTKWEDITPLAKPLTEAETKASNKEQELLKQRFNDVQSDLADRATNAVKSTINQYIDPKSSMSDYVKTKAVDECAEKLNTQINGDKSFIGKMDSLWKASFDANFSKASLEKIKNTYYAKAQVLLPEIIKDVRARALAGMGKNSPSKKVTEVEDNPRVDSKNGNNNGRSATNKSRDEEGPRRGESTKSFLNRTLGD